MTKMWIVAAPLLFSILFSAPGAATGNQSTQMCPNPGQIITVNVYGRENDVKGEKGDGGDAGAPCKCNLQDSSKPSAHLDGASSNYGTFSAEVLKFWSPTAPHGHLTGGMTYHDGKLTVPTNGRYFIYAQVYFDDTGSTSKRMAIQLNGNRIALAQAPDSAQAHSSVYAGGVFILQAGDVITVMAESGYTKIYRGSDHSYFGAFLI